MPTEVTARACDRKGTDIADLLPAHGWRNSFAKTRARAAIEGLTGALGLCQACSCSPIDYCDDNLHPAQHHRDRFRRVKHLGSSSGAVAIAEGCCTAHMAVD
jgi:hypothetical protein